MADHFPYRFLQTKENLFRNYLFLSIFSYQFWQTKEKIFRNYLFLSIEQLSFVLLSNSHQPVAVIDELILPFIPAFYEKLVISAFSLLLSTYVFVLKRSILCGRIRKRLNQLGLLWEN